MREHPKSKSARQQPETFPVASSVGYQIRMTHRMLQRYRQLLVEPYGVSAGMWFLLRVLWEEDGLTQCELSRRIGTKEPTTVVSLRAMLNAGFIQRVRNGVDRRKVNIFLTAKGRSLQKTAVPLAKHVVDTAVSGFSQTEVHQLLSMLDRIQNNLSDIDKAGADEIKPNMRVVRRPPER
jgi:MarR family transcriptional regulator, organic hydroperoxide resistance regulator